MSKEFRAEVLHPALRKLPHRRVIETKAQDGTWNQAGGVAEAVPEGKPEAAQGLAQVIWVSVGKQWPWGLNVITTDTRSCEAVPQLPQMG